MAESSPEFNAAFALLRRYVLGDAALPEVVAALRALPPLASDDVAFGFGPGELPPDADARLEALGRALAEAGP